MTDRPDIESFLALVKKATPTPWQTRFLYRVYERVRESPGDLIFGDDGRNDWNDCALMAAAHTDAPSIAQYALDKERECKELHQRLKYLNSPECAAMIADRIIAQLREPKP